MFKIIATLLWIYVSLLYTIIKEATVKKIKALSLFPLPSVSYQISVLIDYCETDFQSQTSATFSFTR